MTTPELAQDLAFGRVLVVAAHPDDIDFGAAATVARLTAAGSEVAYCLVTSGDAGGSDRSVSREEMVAIRQSEQRAAAAVVGVHDLTFLGYPDGQVTASLELRRDLAREIRRHRPDLLVCPSAERDYARLPASHPDHLATGEAAIHACYPDARNPFAFPELLEEGLEPHEVHEVWVMAHPTATLVVDVTETIDAKLAALACHASQIDDAARLEGIVRGWAGQVAERAGLPSGRFAEGFLKVTVW